MRIEKKMNGLTRYYSILGLTPSAGIDMIKSKYRQLAKNFIQIHSQGAEGISARYVRSKRSHEHLVQAHAQPFAEPKPLSKFEILRILKILQLKTPKISE